MAGDGAVVGASSTKDHYAFGESNAARRAFAGRTIDADLAFLVPFLKPGLSLVDCGCGGGGLAVQLSERLTPGEVVGFDQNGGAIEQAKQLAASVADARVRFFVASVYDAPLPQQHFDIALFCGVLGHIPDPELALRHAFNVLKPGGVIAVRELAKNGDWAGGLHWETVEAVNQMHADDIAVSGGDPFIGRRMKSLLVAAGFERVDALPSFSPALSSVQAIGGHERTYTETDSQTLAILGSFRPGWPSLSAWSKNRPSGQLSRTFVSEPLADFVALFVHLNPHHPNG